MSIWTDAWDWGSGAFRDAYDWTKDALGSIDDVIGGVGDILGDIGDIFGGDKKDGDVFTEKWWIKGDQSPDATPVARIPGWMWAAVIVAIVGGVFVGRSSK